MISKQEQPVHRLKQAREREGMSLRSVSNRTGLSVPMLRHQEETNDIGLADLAKWQQALGIPFADLFNPPSNELDELIMLRAGLVQLTKSVKSLLEVDLKDGPRAMVQNLFHRLTELMPELTEVGSWPTRGTTRRLDEPSLLETRSVSHVWWSEINDVV